MTCAGELPVKALQQSGLLSGVVELRLRRKDPQILAVELIKPKKISSKSVEYGLKKETVARKAYEKRYKAQVIEIGIFVCPFQPWLSASVDGVVLQEECVVKLLEIKCPITCAKLPIFDHKKQKFNVKYLEIVRGIGTIKKTHEYYTQCQIQMYVTGLTICDLFLWSPVDSYVVEIHLDDNFIKQAILKLESFYFKYMIKKLRELEENEPI